jgi:hypothetical protein
MARPIKTHDGDLSALLDDAQGSVLDVAQALGLSIKTIYRRIADEGIDLPRGKGANRRKLDDSSLLLRLLEAGDTVFFKEKGVTIVRRTRVNHAKKELVKRTDLKERGIRNRFNKLEAQGRLRILGNSEMPAYFAWLDLGRDENRFRDLIRANAEYRLTLMDAHRIHWSFLTAIALTEKTQGDFDSFRVGMREVFTYRNELSKRQSNYFLGKISLVSPWVLSEAKDVAAWYELTMSLLEKVSFDYFASLPPWFQMLMSDTLERQAESEMEENLELGESYKLQAQTWLERASPRDRLEYLYGFDLTGEMERLLLDLRQRFAYLKS